MHNRNNFLKGLKLFFLKTTLTKQFVTEKLVNMQYE